MIVRKKTVHVVVFAMVMAASVVMAGNPDQAYITNFGWGKMIFSDKDFPAFAKCDLGLFNVKNGIFQITGGDDVNLNCRILLKDGKTYGYYINKVKQANPKGMSTFKYNFIKYSIYFSHDGAGNQLYRTWPTGLTKNPGWTEYSYIEDTPGEDDEMMGWNSNAILPKNLPAGTQSWIKDARIGYRAYFLVTVGYVRDATEQKYWDKSLLKWMVPIEYVGQEPVAAGSFEIAASTNPRAAWSYTVAKMPAAMDGKAEGELKVLKSGQSYCTFTFTMEKTYENKKSGNGDYMLMMTKKKGAGEDEDTYLGGTRITDVPVQQAITKAFYDAVSSGLSKMVLK